MNPLHELHGLGQSIWYDFISRDFIADGTMSRLVAQGIRGMTSNPTIFEKAIAGGGSYDEQIAALGRDGRSTAEIAVQLFVTDVRGACDVMLPLYNESDGGDGFISIEVSPTLAHDTDATLAEARALWREIDRPNLMVKIPATPAGLPAIRQCIAEGININVTLMFSIEQYRDVASAYIAGLADRAAAGGAIGRIGSVASVFVSRIDTMVDAMLESIGTPGALALRGRLGLANSRLVYQEFKTIFSGPRWDDLAALGARVQRPLWASTSSKNPAYPDLIYVENLIGTHTVNTVPPETLTAIMDHASVHTTIDDGLPEAAQTMHALQEIGIDVDDVMRRLLAEGVSKFVASFESLFEKIEAKRSALATQPTA